MFIWKRLKAALLYQVPQPILSQNQILEKIIPILSGIDDHVDTCVEGIKALDHHVQVIHERQLAILEKLNFMIRTEEHQIQRLVKDLEEHSSERPDA